MPVYTSWHMSLMMWGGNTDCQDNDTSEGLSEQSCASQESATLHQAAVPILRELANNASVYLMTHVIDDVGEATVRGALEDAGLIGHNAGQIKPHRVLFCSTLEGKVSIVRQLEPDLHIDGHSTTVRLPSFPPCPLPPPKDL